jgi:hypothetical protein
MRFAVRLEMQEHNIYHLFVAKFHLSRLITKLTLVPYISGMFMAGARKHLDIHAQFHWI